MTAFSCKKLATPPRFCLCLKQARHARDISIAELERRTHIKAEYLHAIEECRPHDIPAAPVYIKQYIRAYAEVVGLGSVAHDLLKRFDIEETWHTITTHATDQKHPTPSLARAAFLNLPRLARALAVVIILGVFAAGIGTQWFRFVKPPTLAVMNPPDGLITTLSSIIVEGYTEKEVAVHINGTPIQNNEDGTFTAPIPLARGANTIAVQATKKSGKQTTLIRTIIREEARDRLSLGIEPRVP